MTAVQIAPQTPSPLHVVSPGTLDLSPKGTVKDRIAALPRFTPAHTVFKELRQLGREGGGKKAMAAALLRHMRAVGAAMIATGHAGEMPYVALVDHLSEARQPTSGQPYLGRAYAEKVVARLDALGFVESDERRVVVPGWAFAGNPTAASLEATLSSRREYRNAKRRAQRAKKSLLVTPRISAVIPQTSEHGMSALIIQDPPSPSPAQVPDPVPFGVACAPSEPSPAELGAPESPRPLASDSLRLTPPVVGLAGSFSAPQVQALEDVWGMDADEIAEVAQDWFAFREEGFSPQNSPLSTPAPLPEVAPVPVADEAPPAPPVAARALELAPWLKYTAGKTDEELAPWDADEVAATHAMLPEAAYRVPAHASAAVSVPPAAPPAPRRPQKPATLAQSRALFLDHQERLGGGVNLKAIVNIGAPFEVMQGAFSVAAENVAEGRRRGRRVRNPGGYILEIVRRAMAAPA